MYPDFLTCGKCADEFPLSKIDDFIIHKTSCLQSLHGQSYSTLSSVATVHHALLSCVHCGLDFHTARGLLQHLQSTHQMDIVLLRTPVSAQHDFFPHQNQQNTFSTVANGYSIAGGSSGHTVHSGSASSSGHSTDLMHTAEDVSVSPAVKQELPMACAKLAASEGTTICCNGQECKVTINPPSGKEQPKKCCSAVVPKKRTRHMQEHDSEDMEQSALKTLAGFRGRFMLSHKAKSSHSRSSRKKSGGDTTSKSTHKRKAKCVLRCETESGKVIHVKNTDVCEEEVEEEAVEEGPRGSCEKEQSEASSNDDSDCESGERKQKIKLYSIEKENITSRKTVITNTGVTLTLEPTEPTKSKQRETEESRHQNVTLPPHSVAQNQAFDASRESAEILAELLCHARQPSADPSILMPSSVQHNTVNTAEFGQVPLVSVAHPLVQPSASALIPSNIVDPAGNTLAVINPFTSADVTASVPNPAQTSAHMSISKPPTHFTTSTSMGTQQVDLTTMSPSIRLFDSLDHSSNDGLTIAVPEVAVSLDDQASSSDPKQDSPGGDSGKVTPTGSGKKRRYPTTRPYKCSQCEQAFNQPIHLKKHMSKHTGVKPFKCDQCEYSTVERSHLKAHNRIHTGEKPFQCNFCSYATAQNSTLRVHLKRHHSNQVQQVQAATSNAVPVNQQSL